MTEEDVKKLIEEKLARRARSGESLDVDAIREAIQPRILNQLIDEATELYPHPKPGVSEGNQFREWIERLSPERELRPSREAAIAVRTVLSALYYDVHWTKRELRGPLKTERHPWLLSPGLIVAGACYLEEMGETPLSADDAWIVGLGDLPCPKEFCERIFDVYDYARGVYWDDRETLFRREAPEGAELGEEWRKMLTECPYGVSRTNEKFWAGIPTEERPPDPYEEDED